MSPPKAPQTGARVRVVHASHHRGDVGTVVGPATQAGMAVVVEFGAGDLAEFRAWELEEQP